MKMRTKRRLAVLALALCGWWAFWFLWFSEVLHLPIDRPGTAATSALG